MAQSGNAMAGIGGGLGKFTELRQRLLFVVGALIVYRIGCYIPVPGVNPEAMLALMETQKGTIVDMFNMFSGGALHRFSLFALNVMPYISASIIVQLLVQIVPSLKAIQKEGESGRRKINQWSRMGAIPLAVFQAWGIATALQAGGASQGIAVVYNPGPGFILTAVIALTAGTMFLMWLGEQVTERGIGNGVSLIIFAGIVAGLPAAVIGMFEQIRNGDMSAADGDRRGRADRAGLHLSGGVRRTRPAPDHGELRPSSGWPQRLPEPVVVPAAQAQHVRRDPGDLRLEHRHVPGDGRDLVQPGRFDLLAPARQPVAELRASRCT